MKSLLKSTCCERATPPSCGENAARHRSDCFETIGQADASKKKNSAQRAAQRQNSCMTSLVSRKCTQVVLQRSFRKCVYSSARQKKKRGICTCCSACPSATWRAAAHSAQAAHREPQQRNDIHAASLSAVQRRESGTTTLAKSQVRR